MQALCVVAEKEVCICREMAVHVCCSDVHSNVGLWKQGNTEGKTYRKEKRDTLNYLEKCACVVNRI